MNIVIIGQGAIGLLWYYHLANNSRTHVSLLCSKRATPPKYMQFKSVDGKTHHCLLNLANEHTLAQAELVIFCLKAYQFNQAFNDYIDFIPPHVPTILCHNGMLIEHALPKNYRLLSLLLTHGSKTLDKFSIEHTGQGHSELGLLKGELSNQQASMITQNLSEALPVVTWCNNVKEKQWTKLAINCVINPLTAIYNCTNGDITAENYGNEINAIINEVAAVAKKEEISLNIEQLQNTCLRVAQNTATNTSSMRGDILACRQTEIAQINGFIHQQGKKWAIATPMNTKLWQQVSALESHYLR